MLTSRERCICAIECEEPDRIPLSLNMRPAVLNNLKKRLRVQKEEEIYQALDIDIRHTEIELKGGYNDSSSKWKVGLDGSFEVSRDIWGVEKMRSPERKYTYKINKFPLQHIPIEEYDWPDINIESLRRVRKDRLKFINHCLYGGVIHVFQRSWHLIGFNNLIVGLFTGSKLVKKVIQKLNNIRIKQAILLSEQEVDVIAAPDDIGTQRGMMIPPNIWRKYFKPGLVELINTVKRKGAFTRYHTDGNIMPIIPDLVQMGLDILDPVQPECMNPVHIKEQFGNSLCLEKTIGSQSTLPFGTPDIVSRLVKKRIENLGPSGLILGASNAVQNDVPLENILALYKTAKKYGRMKPS